MKLPITDLHSNMERFKVKYEISENRIHVDLHSNMERFKVGPEPDYTQMAAKFTFQYGEI